MTATATAPPARKSETGDKAPKMTRSCNCGTVKVGKGFVRGACFAETKKSFAQGHDARMSARVATEIAEGVLPMAEGLAEVRKAGGGEQLVSKTQWSANLRAKKGHAKKADKTCRTCDKPVATKGDAKNAGLCDECNEAALDENARADGHEVSETEQDEANAKVVADQDLGTIAKIKIGRWTYDAVIGANGDADYSNKRGEHMTAVAGSFTTVK
jgi:hypothetical protein